MCHDIHTKFDKGLFSIRKLMVREYIYIQTHRQQGDLTSLLLFFRNKKSRLRGFTRKVSQYCDSAFLLIPRNL
jgi:hypothetical protein